MKVKDCNFTNKMDKLLVDYLCDTEIFHKDDDVLYAKIPYDTGFKKVIVRRKNTISDVIDLLQIEITFSCVSKTAQYFKNIFTAPNKGCITPPINLGFASSSDISSFIITNGDVLEDSFKHKFEDGNELMPYSNTVKLRGYMTVFNALREPK